MEEGGEAAASWLLHWAGYRVSGLVQADAGVTGQAGLCLCGKGRRAGLDREGKDGLGWGGSGRAGGVAGLGQAG